MSNHCVIIAALALIMLIFAPVSGATGDHFRTYINQSATVFYGEEGLDINAAMGGSDAVGCWDSGETMTNTPSHRVDVTGRKNNFQITTIDFKGCNVETWYRLDSNMVRQGIAFMVKDPYLTVDVMDVRQSVNVNGKVVVIGQPLTFRVNTNMWFGDANSSPKRFDNATLSLNDTIGYITIKVKSPEGSTYSSLMTNISSHQSIEDLIIPSSSYNWNYTWFTNATTDGRPDGQRVYQPGTYTIWAETNLNRMKENYRTDTGADYTGKTVSAWSTIMIGSDTLSILPNRDTVVRGKSFSISITGRPSTVYYIWVKGTTKLTGGPDNEAPRIILNQEGVEVGTATFNFTTNSNQSITEITGINKTSGMYDYYARVTTDASGQRTIAFSTNGNTKPQKYTIRVESLSETTNGQAKADEVDMGVNEGTLSIVAAGNQNYYLGEEIKLSGMNSETYETYLFIIGPNLDTGGANLDSPRVGVINNNANSFVHTNVDSDNSWEYKWGTAALSLDAGTYTIYAVSAPKDRQNLDKVTYGTVSVVIKKPFISASVQQSTVARGDDLVINGQAEGNPSTGVAVWTIGKNYAKRSTVSVSSDGSFKYDEIDTSTLSSGQYFVVVQHPMQNGIFDIDLDSTKNYVRNLVLGTTANPGMTIFQLFGPGSLQGSDAAEALIQAISDPNIDDTYTKLQFIVSEPFIRFDKIPDVHVGDKFTVTGRTNLAIEDQVFVEIYSSSFKPTQKSQSGEFSGATATVKVIKGNSTDGYNEFNLDVDSSTFKSDEYIVAGQAILQGTTGTTLFMVVDGSAIGNVTGTGATTPGTPATNVVPTPLPTALKTAVPTPLPTTAKPAPGFGAVFALIGLIAVSAIIIRRKD